MANLNSELADSLLNAVRGEGEAEVFSAETVEKSRESYFKACEESELKERARRAKAYEEASKIYLTF